MTTEYKLKQLPISDAAIKRWALHKQYEHVESNKLAHTIRLSYYPHSGHMEPIIEAKLKQYRAEVDLIKLLTKD